MYCGNAILTKSNFCSKCGKELIEKKPEYEKIEKWEYLWPIFFGVFGGLLLYFRYRKKNKKAAMSGFLVGSLVSIAIIIIMSALGSL